MSRTTNMYLDVIVDEAKVTYEVTGVTDNYNTEDIDQALHFMKEQAEIAEYEQEE